MRGTIHSDGPLAPFGLKYRRPSKWSVILSLAGPEYGCKMAVSQDFISDDRHGWRQREDDQAPRHADAGQRRGHRDSHHSDGPDQQPQLESFEPSNQVVVQRIGQSKERADRQGDAQNWCERADLRLMPDEIRCDTQTGPGRDDRGDDQYLTDAPHEGAIAVRLENWRGRQEIVQPPHPEGQRRPRDANERRVHRPALLLNYG